MGSRLGFSPPQEIYDEKYAEVYRQIESDLFAWRWGLIEAFEQEWHDADARMLSYIAGNADKPEKILELAISGILGQACRDQMALAIAHVANHQTLEHVRGYWPLWDRE